MSEFVGKIVPGCISAFIGIYVLVVFGTVVDNSTILVAGFMAFWGISTAYAPIGDAIEELRDYMHKYSAKKLGVLP